MDLTGSVAIDCVELCREPLGRTLEIAPPIVREQVQPLGAAIGPKLEVGELIDQGTVKVDAQDAANDLAKANTLSKQLFGSTVTKLRLERRGRPQLLIICA